MHCQRRLLISRVKNIGIVLEQSGVAFRLAPPYGGLLVGLFMQHQKAFTPVRPGYDDKILNTALKAIVSSSDTNNFVTVKSAAEDGGINTLRSRLLTTFPNRL